MSDDGMLLNFSTEPSTSAVRKPVGSKVQGGRWKDRLNAKRAQVKQYEKENPEVRVARVAKERAIKEKAEIVRQKRTAGRNGGKKPPGTGTSEASGSGAGAGAGSGSGSNGSSRARMTNFKKPTAAQQKQHPGVNLNPEDKNTFVSSLFSSNPSLAENDAEDKPVESHEASNAPLKDDTTFEGLGVNSALTLQLSTKMKIPTPTRIQRAALPPLISSNRDLFIQAQTGSGKTLAYALPIIHRLMSTPDLTRESGLFALILTPTRELSTQIYSVLEKLVGACHWLVPGIVIGGEKKKSEKARIRKGINILVATPGRLCDHFDNTESLDLSQIRWVVLDEGDRLMELGFEEAITKILTKIGKTSMIHDTAKRWPQLPNKRVNILCSATMRDDVKRLGELSLSHAEWVTPDSVGEDSKKHLRSDANDNHEHIAPAQLIQQSAIVPAKLRLVTLAGLLKAITSAEKGSRTIVFFSCSDSVDFHFKAFTKGGTNRLKQRTSNNHDSDDEDDTSSATQPTVMTSVDLDNTVIHKLHGSLNQQLRTSTLSSFSAKDGAANGESYILFCTDVASRGLDLPHITQVIEYDPPFGMDDHLHRVGRTARAGKEGTSILFLLPGAEEKYLDVIKPNHPNGIHPRSYEDILKKGFGSKWDVDATTWHLNIERWLLEDASALQLAKRGYTSHIRAYTTHLSSEREIFNLRALHLGHLAKSFALRETPGKMSKQPSSKTDKTKPSSKKTKSSSGVAKPQPRGDADGNRRRMLAVAKSHAGMSEFNIGY
ncbi:Dbp7p [Sugiyamaella lignohabitans]|uniref:ATP-dependent RNA helicase n=1 Tax=Sugiyamaella lignohabitans TaxID=796027 RepID=A0A161HIG9_9ASCO|nr:Dbp7p [Sugiyamaella lignohabitans]ANB10938.1 Dbp7p [Sugiyamaella lignohabitans]